MGLGFRFAYSWHLQDGFACSMYIYICIYIYTCITFKGFAGLHGNVYLFIEMLILFGHIWGCERLSGVIHGVRSGHVWSHAAGLHKGLYGVTWRGFVQRLQLMQGYMLFWASIQAHPPLPPSYPPPSPCVPGGFWVRLWFMVGFGSPPPPWLMICAWV